MDYSIPFWEGDISLLEFGKRLCPQETELDIVARKVCEALAADRCAAWHNGSRIPASYFDDEDGAVRTLRQALSGDGRRGSSSWQVRRSFRWRTIPQVAVWIRTRDEAKVQGLSERQAQCLFLADEIYPGAFAAARTCLIEALKRGRFSACAMRAQPHIATRDGERGYWRLDERREFIPRLFWERGGLELSGGAVVAKGWDDSEEWDGQSRALQVKPSDQAVHWIDIVIDDDDCVGHWQAPASILEDGPLPLAEVLERLSDEDVPEWFLALPSVVVTGLDSTGARVPVDRGVFEACTIDRASHVLATSDRGLTWHAVMIERADAGASQRSAASPRAPDPSQADVDAWYGRRVTEHGAAPVPPSREDDLAAAKEAFPECRVNVLRTLVRNARRKLAPDRWRRSGAKGRKRAHRKV